MITNIMSKSKAVKIILILILSISVLCLSACAPTKQSDKLYLDFMGTTAYVVINHNGFSNSKLNACYDEIDSLLKSAAKRFSTEDENSLVSRFNRLKTGESITVDEEFITVFNASKQVYSDTQGAFNPASKLLVDLWGFSAKYQEKDYVPTCSYDRVRNSNGSFPLPASEYVTAFKALCDFDSISLGGEKLTKNCPPVTVNGEKFEQEIDLSGIVKGYVGDKIKTIIDSYGFVSYYFSLGTSSMYLSEKPEGKPFELGITDPENPSGATKLSVSVQNKSVSTSGTYQNRYELDGKTYHHIIDCSTGAPKETEILSLTIIGDNGAYCDGLSTALIVMGLDNALAYLQSSELDYVIITNDIVYSSYE